MVADISADMEVHMVADMEVDKVADMEVDKVAEKANLNVLKQCVLGRSCLMRSVPDLRVYLALRVYPEFKQQRQSIPTE